jgi:glycosyltransferase involved in cell wall biosynthesis
MVTAPWHGGLPRSEAPKDFRIRRIRQIRTAIPALVRSREQRHQPPFPDPVSVLDLRRAITEFDPDLIHAYGWIAFSVAAALGRREVPVLLSARDYGYFCSTRTLLRKGETACSGPGPIKCLGCAGQYYGVPKGWLAALGVAASKPLLRRKVSALHSVSTYVEEVTMAQLRKPGLRAVTIPSFQAVREPESDERPVDVQPWLRKLPADPFILYVGAFRRVKGLQTLFDAYEKLEDPPPLVLMGTYERDSPEHFPANATVLTDVPNAAVMAAWDKAMFGVMPSLWPEPLGATVAEGMSSGRPVIGTEPGGHRDMLTPETGMLVPAGDVAALAAAMADLIASPERREALGRAAAERAREFAAAAVLPRFEATYADVTARGPAPR